MTTKNKTYFFATRVPTCYGSGMTHSGSGSEKSKFVEDTCVRYLLCKLNIFVKNYFPLYFALKVY
jgi:hypothetical protein